MEIRLDGGLCQRPDVELSSFPLSNRVVATYNLEFSTPIKRTLQEDETSSTRLTSN